MKWGGMPSDFGKSFCHQHGNPREKNKKQNIHEKKNLHNQLFQDNWLTS